MKKSNIFIISVISFIIWACSVKNDAFLNRNFHALNTKFNVNFNGEEALAKGIEEVNKSYQDNFWEILPLERLQSSNEELKPGQTKNANFERAEEKATKAIQKHSMLIGGYEKNFQADESFLLLGKARYYERNWFPAIEAFNYILFKHPNSNSVYQAKVWREKVHIILDQEDVAIKNLKKTLKEKIKNKQDQADLNAILAQAYIKSNILDTAIVHVKKAIETTTVTDEKARYRFILAQLYENIKQPDSAKIAYQSVINMKRKASRQYHVHAKIKQAMQLSEGADSLAFHKPLDELIKNIENKPFLDFLFHQKALYYDKKNNFSEALKYYNKSLRTNPTDPYLVASNYRNIHTLYYKKHNFYRAKKYIDSTMIVLEQRQKEYKSLKKRQEVLDEVVKNLDIVKSADSVISVTNMSKSQKIAYYQKHIKKIKLKDSLEAVKFAEQNALQEQLNNQNNNNLPPDLIQNQPNNPQQPTFTPKTVASIGDGNKFYFYNPNAVAQGREIFLKKWGKIDLKDNWKFGNTSSNSDNSTAEEDTENVSSNETDKDSVNGVPKDPKYTLEYYIDKLPTDSKTIDSIQRDGNYARFKLGEIYKEKLRENKLAIDAFEGVLSNKPDSKMILPSYYNLYQLCQSEKLAKAEDYKNKILTQYPNSRYAQNISSGINTNESLSNPEFVEAYKKMKEGKFRELNAELPELLKKYESDEINSKFDVIKATVTARLEGIEAYKKALKRIIYDYPKSAEKENVEKILNNEIPRLEALTFDEPSKTYNIVYLTPYPNEITHKDLIAKFEKYIKNSGIKALKFSNDIYTIDKNFLVVHGMTDKNTAESIISFMRENKEYKIKEIPTVISSEDYKVVMIKKNFEDYLNKIK